MKSFVIFRLKSFDWPIKDWEWFPVIQLVDFDYDGKERKCLLWLCYVICIYLEERR